MATWVGVGEYDESAAGLHFGGKLTSKCKETCCKRALCALKCLEIALQVHLYHPLPDHLSLGSLPLY